MFKVVGKIKGISYVGYFFFGVRLNIDFSNFERFFEFVGFIDFGEIDFIEVDEFDISGVQYFFGVVEKGFNEFGLMIKDILECLELGFGR